MNFLILALLSLIVTAISSAIGFTSGGLQLLDAINKVSDRDAKRKLIRRLAVIALSLTVVFALVGVPSFLSSLPLRNFTITPL
jgi:predicted Abi (CAAX) family protease